MSPEKLVLLKPRSQRLAEMIWIPVVVLPVGPLIRALLGAQYSIFYGLLVVLVLTVLLSKGSNRWAARHGGKWVTSSERLRCLIAETASMSPWVAAVLTTAMVALIVLGGTLTIAPLDEMSSAVGATPAQLCLVWTLLSLAAGGQVILRWRRTSRLVVAEEVVPAGYFGSELRRVLPRTYLAWALAAVTGIALGLQLEGFPRSGAFLIVYGVMAPILSQLLTNRRATETLYPALAEPRFGRLLIVGLTGFAPFMALCFTGFAILGSMNRPILMAAEIGVVVVICAVGGLCFGAFLYLVRRFIDRNKDTPANTLPRKLG